MNKKETRMVTALFLLFFLITTQTLATGNTANEDYFADKWEVLLSGLPDGDVTLIFKFTRDNGELKGVVTDVNGTSESTFERVVEREESVTVYWTAEGHYVNVDLKITDENSMTGMLMGMFNASAKRILE
jgi:hypothetical protein